MASEILGINEIKNILPYRYPMLLLDRVKIESDTKCIGLKNISVNEQYFNGHFPEHPIVPGVLQIESMEQLAQIAVHGKIQAGTDGEIYIKELRKVKFRKPNYPGDRMYVEAEVKSVQNNEAEIVATTRNASGLTCQAEITLAVRPIQKAVSMPEGFNEFDKTEKIALDNVAIKKIIPHRFPFLLIDYIISMEGTHVTAVKNATYNEPIYRGYAPDYAVLPGALQAEMVAQAGCVFMLSRPENQGKLGLFMAIDKSEFFHPVLPGDQLICEVDIPEGKSRFGKGDGLIRVGDKIVSKTTMTFAIV